jgi:hypothetical protein
MDTVRAAWLRALVEASGPGRRWVNAREIASVLSDIRGMPQRASSHAAGANMRRLRQDGFAEAEQTDGFTWWRPSVEGIAAARTAT